MQHCTLAGVVISVSFKVMQYFSQLKELTGKLTNKCLNIARDCCMAITAIQYFIVIEC